MTVAEVVVVICGKFEVVGINVGLTRGDVLITIEVVLGEEVKGDDEKVPLTSSEAAVNGLVVILKTVEVSLSGTVELTGDEDVLNESEVPLTG